MPKKVKKKGSRRPSVRPVPEKPVPQDHHQHADNDPPREWEIAITMGSLASPRKEVLGGG
jgi:hypothetical protein